MGTICSSIFNKSYVHYSQTDKVVSHPVLKEFLVFQDVITGNLVFGKEISLNNLKIEDPARLERHQLFAHANVIKFEGFKKNDEVNYLALFESYESTLQQEIQERSAKNSKFTENEILGILQSATAALAYFQKKDIYYGQLRPENLVKKGDEYKLLDMVIFNETKTTYEQIIEGDEEVSHRYLSPELTEALSNGVASPEYEKYKQDIYSLGIIILDAMTLNFDASKSISEKLQTASARYSQPLVDLVRQILDSDVKKRMDAVSCNRIVENMYYGFPISDESDPVYLAGPDLKPQVQSVIPEYYEVQPASPQKKEISPARDLSSPHSELSSPQLDMKHSLAQSYKADPANQEALLNKYLHNGYTQSPQSELEQSPYVAKSQSAYSSSHHTSPTLSNHLFNTHHHEVSPQPSQIKRTVQTHPVISTTSPKTLDQRNLSPLIKNDPLLSKLLTQEMQKQTEPEDDEYASPTRKIMAEANALLRSMEKNASLSIQADPIGSPDSYLPRKAKQQSPVYSPLKFTEQKILTTEAHTTNRYHTQMTQKTSRNGDSGHKPLETSPMIFTTSPDQQERQLNSVHFTSQDLYGDGRPYSFRPYNQQHAADAAADSYRNLTEGNDDTSHLVDHQNRKITPIAMSDTYLSKPYDYHYTASSDFFANNLSMQPDLLKGTDTVISRRYDEKDGSRLKEGTGLLHTSSSNFLFGDKTKLFGEHQHHQVTKESDLIDQRIQQIDSMIHNVNELNKKISAKSAKDYDRELFKSKHRSYVQDMANLSGKKSPNIFDTLDTKISQTGLSKPKSDVYQSSLNPRSSSIRTMGYALEVLRNDMKHNFLTEVDEFIDKRLTPPRKKRSDRLKTLENEIEQIRKIKESDFHKIPTLASEVEDLGIHMSNLRVSRANRRAPQIGVEEIPKNRVYVTEMYKDGSKYEGELQGGLRHGQGKLTYSDGTWFDGTWMLDRIEGYGAFYYESNKVSYEGEWKNNKREGNGVMYNEQVTHIGEGYLDRPFDRSENTWEKYEGEFKNDDWHGSGRLTLSNGDVFQGTFKKGVIQGKGTYMTSRGEMVIGEWQENTLIRIS